MNTRNPLAVLGAAILLGTSLIITAQGAGASRFTDADPAQWYYSALDVAAEAGLLGGHYGNTLNPSGKVTAGELAEVIFRSQQIWVRGPERGEAWYGPYLDAAKLHLGAPVENRTLTRLESAEIVFRILGLSGCNTESPYMDMNDPMLNALKEAGIMGGKIRTGELVFSGGDLLTRAELVTIASNLVEYRQKHGSPRNICPYYAGLEHFGTLIDPNVPYPMKPNTLAEIKQACDYAAIHELDSITFHYSGERPEDFQDRIYGYLSELSRNYWYERPEYFIYMPHLSFTVEDIYGGYELTIKFSATDATNTEMQHCRREAFAAAIKVHNLLYTSGTITVQMNEMERAKAILGWVLSHATYQDSGDSLSHTAWSIFTRGTGVCDAYSSALQILLSVDGIQSWGQKGHSRQDGRTHHWTVAVLDGEKVNIDATWCDDASSGYRYEYYAVPDERLALTHTW